MAECWQSGLFGRCLEVTCQSISPPLIIPRAAWRVPLTGSVQLQSSTNRIHVKADSSNTEKYVKKSGHETLLRLASEYFIFSEYLTMLNIMRFLPLILNLG